MGYRKVVNGIITCGDDFSELEPLLNKLIIHEEALRRLFMEFTAAVAHEITRQLYRYGEKYVFISAEHANVSSLTAPGLPMDGGILRLLLHDVEYFAYWKQQVDARVKETAAIVVVLVTLHQDASSLTTALILMKEIS